MDNFAQEFGEDEDDVVVTKKRKVEPSDSEEEDSSKDSVQGKKEEVQDDGRDPCELLEQLKTSPVDDDITLPLATLGKVFNELHARWTVVGGDEEKEQLWADPIALACSRYGGSIVHTDKSDAGNPVQLTLLELYQQRKLEEVHVDKATKMEQFVLIQLSYVFTMEDLLTGQDQITGDVDLAEICGDATDLRIKIDRVGRAILSNKQLLLGFCATLRTHCSANDLGAPKIIDPNAYDIFDRSSKFSPFQELLMFVLRELRKQNLRRSKDKVVMRPLLTRPMPHPETGELQRFNTCSWVPELTERNTPMTFSDFISNRVHKETNMSMWKHMTTNNNLEKVAAYLDKCQEEELPVLISGSTHISFSNGVLELATGKLAEYPVPNASSIVSLNYIDQPCPTDIGLQDLYNSNAPHSNPDFYVSEDGNREDERKARSACVIDWRKVMLKLDKIKTPTLSGIFTMQLDKGEHSEFWTPANVEEGMYLTQFARLKFWHFALLGRLLYEVGDRDNWQVIQFLKGVAGSGKSTLCKLVSWFFRSEDVGYLSNQMRGGSAIGGLMDVYKCKVWMVTEVDTNFGLERTKFQSMVCGEVVLIDQLYNNTINWRWRSHGLLAGNKFFGYKDTSGSVTRRVLNTDFNKSIPESAKDPEMEKKLKEELSAIIFKCSLAYLYLTELYKGCDIWNIVPPYFKWTKEKLSAHCDPLGAFIRHCIGSGELSKDPTMKGGMLWSRLREMFTTSEFKQDLKPADYKDITSSDMQQIGPLLASLNLRLLHVTPRTHEEAEDLLAQGDGDLSKWTKDSTNVYVVVGIFPNRNV
jgi:hypothetical protein